MIPWTVACLAPLSMGFPRHKYCSGLPFPSPRDLPDPGIEPTSPVSSALAEGFFTTEHPGKPRSSLTPYYWTLWLFPVISGFSCCLGNVYVPVGAYFLRDRRLLGETFRFQSLWRLSELPPWPGLSPQHLHSNSAEGRACCTSFDF